MIGAFTHCARPKLTPTYILVGPNYGPVCIRPARSRYLVGPNKDPDNFGLLKARDLIRTIMGRGSFRAAAGLELFGTFQAQPTS